MECFRRSNRETDPGIKFLGRVRNTHWRISGEDLECKVSKEQTKAQPGTVTDVTKDSFSVQTGDGTLIVQELQIRERRE